MHGSLVTRVRGQFVALDRGSYALDLLPLLLRFSASRFSQLLRFSASQVLNPENQKKIKHAHFKSRFLLDTDLLVRTAQAWRTVSS